MQEPTLRRILTASTVSLCIGVLAITILTGLPPDYPMRLIQGAMAAVGAMALVGVAVAFVTTRLSDYRDPADEEEFELLVQRSERLARENLAAEPDETDFMELDPHNPRDFGHDPDELRAQVLRTVRHELAHHLGADELGVRELGL